MVRGVFGWLLNSTAGYAGVEEAWTNGLSRVVFCLSV